MSDIDVVHAADAMMREFGEHAESEAARFADLMLGHSDPAPLLPSLITRIRCGCGPVGTGLQTRSGPDRRGWCAAGRHYNRAASLQ